MDPCWSDGQVIEWDGNFREDRDLMLVCCERDVDVRKFRRMLEEYLQRTSTLVRRPALFGERTYLTLDDVLLRDEARRNPDLFLDRAERLVIDEVQRAPDLLLAIKRRVDERRLRGQYVLTGSSDLLLQREVSESLAGRAGWFAGYAATYLERDLHQLSAIENLADMRRLMNALCLRLGGLVNQAEISRDLAPARCGLGERHRALALAGAASRSAQVGEPEQLCGARRDPGSGKDAP